MTTHHVVTTLNKPTAVTCAASGKFVTPDEDSLIICKGSCIEIHSITAGGITLFQVVNLYGVISKMELFNIPDRKTCSIFLLTDQNYYTILTFHAPSQSVLTEGCGMLQEANVRISDQPISAIIDLHSRTILVSAFTGILFSIPFYKNDIKGKSKEPKQARFEPASIRTNEFDFISMVSLKGVKQSSIAVLLGEMNELKTIKSFKYSHGSNEIVENDKLSVKVESTTHTLIAVPDPIGGVLAIGEYIISYHNLTSASNTPKEISIDPVLVTAHTFLNGSYDKCILGDSDGVLYLLRLEISNMAVVSLSSMIIGQVSFPNSIVDLGYGMLYIGSAQGDPCIVRMVQKSATGKYTIELVSSFSNLGPIVDFCLFDYDQQGKKTMVCCSGVDKDGCLRVVENGIGFLEKYCVEIPLINNVWSLNSPHRTNDIIVVSTCFDTIILSQKSNTEIQELHTYSELSSKEATLALASSKMGYIIQVTPSSVKVVSYGKSGKLIAEWKPPPNEQITIAKADENQCIVCCGRGTLVYLEYTKNRLIERSSKEFPDISCVNLSSKEDTSLGKDYILASTWAEPTVYLLNLPDLSVAFEQKLTNVCPKDILLAKLESRTYLMVLLGNGQLMSYSIERSQANDKVTVIKEKQTMVGTYCTGMYPYIHEHRRKLFIAGSRPTVISSFNQNLYFSTVNIKDIFAFTRHNNEILLMTEKGLLCGQIDANQKLHHTKIPLEAGMPSRIQYLDVSKLIAVGSVSTEKDANNGFNVKKGHIQILDAQTFQTMDTYDFEGIDLVESITVATFAGYPNQEYLFVGTVVEDKDDPDSSTGRIFVFVIKDNSQLELLDIVEKPGIIYSMRAFQNSVIACVNGSIYTMTKFRPDLPKGERVAFDLNLHKNVLALSLDTRKDKVLVGDLMRSLSVLSVSSKDPLKVELIATDPKPAWTTAVKIVNSNVFIGADDRNNVYTLALEERPNPGANTSTAKLLLQGGFHIGSLINCFRDDTLMDVSSSASKEMNILTMPIEKSFTYATVHGSIGTIKTISSESFEFFFQIQESILKESMNVGRLDYHLWRDYKPKISGDVMNPPQGLENEIYLDGDILKQFLIMPKEKKTQVLRNIESLSEYEVTDIENLINSLVSLHK